MMRAHLTPAAGAALAALLGSGCTARLPSLTAATWPDPTLQRQSAVFSKVELAFPTDTSGLRWCQCPPSATPWPKGAGKACTSGPYDLTTRARQGKLDACAVQAPDFTVAQVLRTR